MQLEEKKQLAGRVLTRFKFGGTLERLKVRAWDTWLFAVKSVKATRHKVELLRANFGVNLQKKLFQQWKTLYEQAHAHRFFDDAVRPHLAFVRLHLNTWLRHPWTPPPFPPHPVRFSVSIRCAHHAFSRGPLTFDEWMQHMRGNKYTFFADASGVAAARSRLPGPPL